MNSPNPIIRSAYHQVEQDNRLPSPPPGFENPTVGTTPTHRPRPVPANMSRHEKYLQQQLPPIQQIAMRQPAQHAVISYEPPYNEHLSMDHGPEQSLMNGNQRWKSGRPVAERNSIQSQESMSSVATDRSLSRPRHHSTIYGDWADNLSFWKNLQTKDNIDNCLKQEYENEDKQKVIYNFIC